MGTKGTKKPDQRLVEKIRNRIRWDARASNLDVQVVCHSGEVLLQGKVDKQFRKKAIVDIVSSIYGVKRVIDQITVKTGFNRSDAALEALLSAAFVDFKLANGERIFIDCNDGVVTLTGMVYRPRLKAAAATSAWSLSGVKDCINQIRIKSESTANILAAKVQWALPQAALHVGS